MVLVGCHIGQRHSPLLHQPIETGLCHFPESPRKYDPLVCFPAPLCSASSRAPSEIAARAPVRNPERIFATTFAERAFRRNIGTH